MAEKSDILLNVDFKKKTGFRGRSVENGLPVTAPLFDLEDLLAWKPDDLDDAGQVFSISSVPYYGKAIPKETPRTLVCHDMAGGYLDDRFVQGTLSTEGKWYYLANWDIIDTFVYFSHHFVTIPPVGWINSAHTNGVAVLGTLITEWDVGYKRCDVIFSHEWLSKKVADQLVDIAKYYRFEGWLINIENKIRSKNSKNLLEFVQYLTERMHDAIEGSQVLWYDSVTEDGILDWQNELNSKNRVYFEACDGIFLNYNWSKQSLEKSAEVAIMLGRLRDVYVGVDVFGRGCYGGGGMNSAAALEVIRRFNLSAAIFAPGWVKEVLGANNFEEHEKIFWMKLAKYCNYNNILSSCEKPYIATDFDPGISVAKVTEKAPIRFLHLNRQSAMPHLSSSSFSSLKIGYRQRNCITVDGNVDVDFFKMRFASQNQSLLICAETGCNLKMQLHVNDKKISCGEPNGHFKDMKFWVLKFDTSPPHVLHGISFVSKSPFSMQKLIVVDCPMQDNIISKPLRCRFFLDEPSKSKWIDLSLEDASWKKVEGNNSVLLLSCTLLLSNIDELLPVALYYQTIDPKHTDLGISRCKKFRIKDLIVPNPIHHGPDVRLAIKAEQISPVYPVYQPDIPSRYGELVVQYAENISPM